MPPGLPFSPPIAGQSRIKGVDFPGEQLTSHRGRAPVAPLSAANNRGNHGGIAPTQIGESAPVNWTRSNGLRSVVWSLKPLFSRTP
mgnify:CR=1 FL=1